MTFLHFPTEKTKQKEWIQKIQRDKEADFHVSTFVVAVRVKCQLFYILSRQFHSNRSNLMMSSKVVLR